jgi:hypothetical protein
MTMNVSDDDILEKIRALHLTDNTMAPKKDKTTKDDLQNTTQKTKYQVTQTLLKP